MCRVSYGILLRKYHDVFGLNPFAIFYDLQSILYTLKELELGGSNEKNFELNSDDCATDEKLKRFTSVNILIRKVSTNFELKLGDLTALNYDVLQQNQCLQHFIELAVNQATLFNS